MNRTIITLIGTARDLSARQILLALNMNRVQNAISSQSIKEIITTSQTRVHDVLIYIVPQQYSINNTETARNHKLILAKYTPYESVIIHTYEKFRPMPNEGQLFEEYCRRIGIDAVWNPFSPVENNDRMLINLLGLNAL
jgi:urocanate hydratase